MFAHDPDTTDAKRIQCIVDNKYQPVELKKIVRENCKNLDCSKKQLFKLLSKNRAFIQWVYGKLKTICCFRIKGS
jgi:hypothetical protein